MILSGTVIGLVCVGALLLAAIVLALLDRSEKVKGNIRKSKFLSKIVLILFLGAFVGGVVVTLLGGVKPREEAGGMMGGPMSGGPMMGSGEGGPAMKGGMAGGTIGTVDEEEFNRLQEKVAKDPKDVKSRERLGHLYLQMQDFENVFKLAHEALAINPKSAESRVHMGMVFFAMQDKDQAMAQFDEALKIDPQNVEALRFKGMVQRALQNTP